jgi:hypothetical protein
MAEKIPDKQKVTEYYEQKLNRKLTEAEVEECLLSLFYLGRAIYKYNLFKQGVKDDLSK